MPTRRSAILIIGSLIGLSGCNGSSEETTERPTTEPPSPDHRTVKIQNNDDQPREVDIEVSKDGEILHEGTHSISAGETKRIYNTSSDDLGGASISVKASTDSDTLKRLDSGFDQPPIEIEPDGNLTTRKLVRNLVYTNLFGIDVAGKFNRGVLFGLGLTFISFIFIRSLFGRLAELADDHRVRHNARIGQR